jgi:hypothetical protein
VNLVTKLGEGYRRVTEDRVTGQLEFQPETRDGEKGSLGRGKKREKERNK